MDTVWILMHYDYGGNSVISVHRTLHGASTKRRHMEAHPEETPWLNPANLALEEKQLLD